MLTVISPAKTLDFETPATTEQYSQPAFLKQSQQLIDGLKKLSVQEVASLMSVSDKLAGINVARYQEWQTPFTPDNAKQAILAFKGDVYSGFDAETLDQKDLNFAQAHLRILSGLYGVLKPLDLMQAYRLEMGTKFAVQGAKDLYDFWGVQIREALHSEPAFKDKVLVNLASNEYFKAVNAKQLNATIITPVFKDWKNSQYKMISFYAKKARGLMSRFIIDNQINKPEALKDFDYEGYRFSVEMTKANDWVFIRDHH
ncbi:MAG: peroxide stress protein YaaA [Methylophaga sp.]|nr:peroxide stress protein YaaA [Methylophaga sp.]